MNKQPAGMVKMSDHAEFSQNIFGYKLSNIHHDSSFLTWVSGFTLLSKLSVWAIKTLQMIQIAAASVSFDQPKRTITPLFISKLACRVVNSAASSHLRRLSWLQRDTESKQSSLTLAAEIARLTVNLPLGCAQVDTLVLRNNTYLSCLIRFWQNPLAFRKC